MKNNPLSRVLPQARNWGSWAQQRTFRGSDWNRFVTRRRTKSPGLTELSAATLITIMFGSVGTGATLMYLLDPERGRRRRALTRDKASHALRQEREFLGKASRDLRHRGTGAIARAKRVRGDHPSDAVLIQRVRSALGHYTAHPSAIEVAATDGEVTLHGPILADEIGGVLRGIARVRGVHRVIDHLDRYTSAEHVPELQGERSRSTTVRTGQWPPAYRLIAMGAGLFGLIEGIRRGGLPGSLLATTGAALTVRGLSNRPATSLFGLRARGPIDIQKTIRVERPVSEVFEFWTHPENFPRFMGHVSDVRKDEDEELWHWSVAGPAGARIRFAAEVTTYERDRKYGWRSVAGAAVNHAGIVQFEQDGSDATRVHVHMTYEPPAGALGHAVATLFGKNPKQALDDDLLRMKTLLETGKTTVEGQRVEYDQLH